MYTFAEISKWTSNAWNSLHEGIEAFPIHGISHDTRTLKAGEVYIAIRGENYDGHDFVEQAVSKGAAGIIVEREFPGIGKPQLVVSNAWKALWKIAAGARSTWTGTVIGVTGSAGKTTVKEMIASVLSQKGTVSKTLGNWNNEIGLPLSMIAADRASDYFVFELGMSHPGEIDPLAGLLKPDWALITNIGKAHVGFFRGLDGIADEKSAILPHASHALLDADSQWFDRLKEKFSGPIVTLTNEPFDVSQPGAHMTLNARFAATLGLQLGLSKEEVQDGLDSFENAPMRWQEMKMNDVLFINDAYNANPLSMRAAISTFAELPCDGRKFLVLGGMRELGDSAEEEHRDLGGFIDGFSFEKVITVGELGRSIVCDGLLGVEKSGAAQVLRDELRAGDMVLLKASRGERLETLLEELKTKI